MDTSPAFQMDAASILASLIFVSILIGSTVIWIVHLQKPKGVAFLEPSIEAWSIRWIDFLILISMLFSGVFLANVLAGMVFKDAFLSIKENGLTPWLAVLSITLLQVPLILVYYGAKRMDPEIYGKPLSDTSVAPYIAFKEAVLLFVQLLPLVWIASFIWSGCLVFLQSIGFLDEFKPQKLVLLFTQGGDPVPITLLVLFAVIGAPIVEEIIFRGCIYRFLKSKINLLGAQVISGVLFSAMHWNLMSFVPLFIVGILLARIYDASGNILIPIYFHACFNSFSLFMLLIVSHSELVSAG